MKALHTYMDDILRELEEIKKKLEELEKKYDNI